MASKDNCTTGSKHDSMMHKGHATASQQCNMETSALSFSGNRRIVAWRAVETVIDAGAAWLMRDQLFASETKDAQDARRARILRLTRAMRRERALGCQGHWSYNPSRHLMLLQALRAEKLCAPPDP